MQPAEKKREFIRLRAEGKSYSKIAGQLQISKATCTKWQKELEASITELQREQLHELCSSYGMTKEARIRSLGDTLEKINASLQAADFSEVDPAKLLDLKLKYAEALKGEYIGTEAWKKMGAVTAEGILAAFADLHDRVRAGEVSAEQAKNESAVLQSLLRAYDTVEVKRKLDQIESMMEGEECGVILMPSRLDEGET